MSRRNKRSFNNRAEHTTRSYNHNNGNLKENIVDINNYRKSNKKRVELLPKNISQEDYIDALENENINIIFATGPAGTGKTYIAMLAAIKLLQAGEIDKIILTRPSVGIEDEKHGFLPGTLSKKMEPWCIPLLDILKKYYSVQEIDNMLENEIIEMTPLGFMRGRTFEDCFVIFDEGQNGTFAQYKAILTRIGKNCKIVITGDLRQFDKKFANDNGLIDFINRIQTTKNVRYISHVEFQHGDIQRSDVVKEVLRLYGEED